MRTISILGGTCILLTLSGCDRKFDDIQSCILGAEKPIPLEKAISVVKAAGLVVSSQEPTPNTPAPSVSAAVAPASGPLNLLCEAEIYGQRFTTTIHLDIASKAANGLAAAVTEDEVKWTSGVQNPVTGKPTLEHHTLSRLNGDYRYYDDGVVYSSAPATYHCSKAPTAQF
ncbi:MULTISPECIES: hypothetical protein [unclassified Pseudomonas]|uniref:hypothetical protein n=1 Tax=unclassified Pseudomonas TaxID=196821 RepID=UPI00128B14A7|nr:MULTISPECIES: hypothetical protein [unclassified Pseudomonas]MPQ69656.1 hypothetical protein [Pseudomonas sp. MWU12-2323]